MSNPLTNLGIGQPPPHACTLAVPGFKGPATQLSHPLPQCKTCSDCPQKDGRWHLGHINPHLRTLNHSMAPCIVSLSTLSKRGQFVSYQSGLESLAACSGQSKCLSRCYRAVGKINWEESSCCSEEEMAIKYLFDQKSVLRISINMDVFLHCLFGVSFLLVCLFGVSLIICWIVCSFIH